MAEPSTPPAPAPADSGRPALPSTADAVPYVPVSWMAVGAIAAAGLLTVLLLVMGWVAFREHRPLLAPELFGSLAVLAVVLSFAARRIVRNSEGTRTGDLFGVDLPATAWWTGVVVGLGYAAYFFAIDYAVSRDAEGEVERWVGTVLKVKDAYVAEDPNLSRAFHRTRDPNERATIGAEDTKALEARWGNEFIAFRQCDLLQVVYRNPDGCTFQTGGLREWSMKPTGVECVFTGTVTCTEGTFPVRIPLRAVEAGVGADAPPGRQWQVFLPQSGFIQREQARLTAYGWFILRLEQEGGGFGRSFIRACADRRARPFAFIDYAGVSNDPAFRPLTEDGAKARSAAVGVTAGFAWFPGSEMYAATAARLFKNWGGDEPTPDQKKRFFEAWNTVGFVPAGSRLSGSPDVNDLVVITDTSVAVRVPIEIPSNLSTGSISAARGRLVVECTDPWLLTELKRLRASGHPDQGTAAPPDEVKRGSPTWKVVRIESDLKPVVVQSREREMPGGPDGPVGP